MRLKTPDWLFHTLTVSGDADMIATFRTAAAGAGIIPWRFDAERMEDDMFHLLVAPAPPQQRTLSVAGCRILARRLREAAQHRHALAVAQVGRSRACPFDLHAVLPVPPAILECGPDDPASDAWLWGNWGTTQALRHVVAFSAASCSGPQPAGQLRISFWSADWTPWQAVRQLRAQWPALRFEVRPDYGS
jgi:hypothetical protein